MAPAVVVTAPLNAPDAEFELDVNYTIEEKALSQTPVFRQAVARLPTHKDEAVVSDPSSESKTNGETDSYSENKTDWLHEVTRELLRRPREEQQYLEAVLETSSRADASVLRTFTLISGPNGSGRTLLARSIKPVVDKMGGYLISGKFEKYTQPTPLGAYVMAINEFIQLVIRRGENEIELFAKGIEEYAGSNVGVLLRWIPALGKIIKPLPKAETTTNAGSMDRFAFALKAVRRAMDKTGRPIFLLLENIHLADTSSLEMLASMLRRAHECTGYLIATVDNQIAPDSDVAAKLRDAEDLAKVKIINIPVVALSEERIEQVFASNLEMNQEDPKMIASTIYQRTGGDFYLTELFIRWMRAKKVISHDPKTGSFFLNKEELHLSLGQKRGSEILTEELETLESAALEVIKISACLGHVVEPSVVALVLDRDISDVMMYLCKKGFLIQCPDSGRYCFGHDYVQETTHNLIPEQDRPLFHVEIGRRLWRRVSEDELELVMFVILDQLERGSHLVQREKERLAVAKLCLHAGQHAAASSSFDKALSVFDFGVSLVDEKWWRLEYHLILSLYSAAIEMHMYAGSFEEMNRLIDEIIEHARTVHDKLRAYVCRLNSLSVSGSHLECVHLGHEVLAMLGRPVCSKARRLFGNKDLRMVQMMLRGKSDDQLLRLPRMQDATSLEAMRIMSLIMLPALSIKCPSAPLVLVRLMKLSLKEGHSIFSPISFVAYGIFCANMLNDVDQAFRFGQLALKLQEIGNRLEYLPRVYSLYFGFIHGWKKPAKEALCPLLRAHAIGVTTGDLEFANLASFLFCNMCIETGHKLADVYRSMQSSREAMMSRRQESLYMISAPFTSFVGHLIGAETEEFNLEDYVARAALLGIERAPLIACVWRMRMHHLFDQVEMAGRALEETDLKELWKAPQFAVIGISNLCAMVAAANLRISRNVAFHKKNLRQMKTRFHKWARSCPHECSSKLALIEAEWASIHGRHELARQKYTDATLLAKGMENAQELAVAHERALCHYIQVDPEAAKYHGQQALDAYIAWGATVKADHLKNRLERSFTDFDRRRQGNETHCAYFPSLS